MKIKISIVGLLLLPVVLQAQERLFFTISATGRLSSGSTTSSLPIQFNKSNDCLKINSGIAVYAGTRGSQSFVMSCRSSTTLPVVQLKLFPNPAVTYSKLVSAALLRNEQQLLIAVVDGQGRVLLQFGKTAQELYMGIDVNVQGLSAGSYFLRVDGRTIHQAIPFIKMN